MRTVKLFLYCFAPALGFLSPLEAQEMDATGPALHYWAVNGTTTPIPYVAPPYSCGTNYYVAPNGKDSNAGSGSAPWQTISRAIAALSDGSPHPGVCVNVAAGTYTESLYLFNLNGGWDAPNGYLVFRSSSLHGASLQEPYANIAKAGNAVIQNSRFVIFDGFEVSGYTVPNAGAHAFQAMNSHHVKFLNNIIHDVGGSGIQSVYSDYVYAQANVVYDTACCNSTGVSAVDFFEAAAADTNPGFHNIISSNIIFNNSEGDDGRTPHTEGHGIVLDRFRLGPAGSYPAQTLIENNLVYGNGGIGIGLYYSDNATIRNNTVFNNFRDPLINYNGADVVVANSSHVVGANNLVVTNATAPNPNILSITDATWDHTNIGNIWANNLTFNGNPGDPSIGSYAQYNLGTPITAANGNVLGADPLFVNAPAGIFKLQSASPAEGAGTAAFGAPALDLAGHVRSQVIDIGAFALNIVPPG
jgi:parallel beta-helix repeat protein